MVSVVKNDIKVIIAHRILHRIVIGLQVLKLKKVINIKIKTFRFGYQIRIIFYYDGAIVEVIYV